ncbi:MAG TPA: cytochrome c family protein [Gemmataceae bacterium]|nr:cytochrome c family protein [Gemmataceae bacterium]
MRLRLSIARSSIFAAGLVAVAGPLLYSNGRAQQPQAGKPAPPASTEKAKYLGADACQLCHETGPRGRFKDDFVRLTEYKTWKTDKHSQAYAKLNEARSKQIGMLLKIADVTKDDRCLNCHAANVPLDLRVGTEGQAYRLEDGVSCDACHGPSSLWLTPHFTEPGWRTKPTAEKQKLGFYDVRDPVERSQLCLSCHVGSMADGKVVTHDMYAAGHPPLPSIEVATFSDSMPRHWRYMKEKGPKIWAAFHYDPKKELEQTRLTVLSGVVALRVAANLLASQARKGRQESGWPEFAQLDCYACHHDLKVESWRLKRGYMGMPGRPQMRSWPLELVKLGIRLAGEEPTRVKQAEDALTMAFSAQPFGDPEKIAAAASDLSAWSQRLTQRLGARQYDQPAARKLLRELCAIAQEGVLDYDSARQVTWAFKIIYSELEPKARDKEVRSILKSLDTELKLELPSGTDKSILGELTQGLKTINHYDPYRFRALIEELSRQLPQD